MPALARIAHHVPGRMRVHVHGAKRNPALLEQVRNSVAEADGVTRVHANRETGSLVIHYRGRTPQQFAGELSRQGDSTNVFDLDVGAAGEAWAGVRKEAEFLAAHSQLASAVVNETKQLDEAVKRATDNAVDLKVLIPLGLAAVSFLYLGTDISTPLWISLGVFSFNSFVALHPPLPYPTSEKENQAPSKAQ